MIDVGLVIQKVDVGAILTRLGIDWDRKKSKRGYELYFACPTGNHQDDAVKKRCSIAESGNYKGLYHCWACGFEGSLIHLIRFIKGFDFKQSLSFLDTGFDSLQVTGIDALQYRLKMNKPLVEIDVPDFSLPDDYVPILDCFGDSADAAKLFLSNERHISEEMMAKFEIGLCYHKHIGFSIVVPVRFQGRIRSLFYAQPFKGGLKRYPQGAPQGRILFNYDRCQQVGSYVMMESILDVIKFESVTGNSAMACFTNMISKHQLELLTGFDEHGVMPDLDGHRGWDLVDRMIPHVGKSLWVYLCPVGKDPGDCTRDEICNAIATRLRYCDYEFSIHLMTMPQATTKVTCIRKK